MSSICSSASSEGNIIFLCCIDPHYVYLALVIVLALVYLAAYSSVCSIFQVIETDTQPSDLCTRREYARWLISASSALSRYTFMILLVFLVGSKYPSYVLESEIHAFMCVL